MGAFRYIFGPLLLWTVARWAGVGLSAALAKRTVAVSEVELDSPVDDIQWFGPKRETTLCRTSGGHLYRSVDRGKNWRDVTKDMGAGGDRGDVFVRQIIPHPEDRQVVVIVANRRRHFASRDGGLTFDEVLHPEGAMHNFLFHPVHSEWALMSVWTPPCQGGSGATPTAGACRHDLYVTRDLGRRWRPLAQYVVQYAWAERSDSVLLTYYTSGRRSHQAKIAGWSPDISFGVIHSLKNNDVKKLVPRGNKFLQSHGFLFVAQLQSQAQQTVQLMVSKDGGRHFSPARLPVTLREKSYTILDVTEDSVMLHVNHGITPASGAHDGILTGNIYVSDASGTRFSLSLPRNVRTTAGECEFDRVSSLDGVYLANFKEPPILLPPERRSGKAGARDIGEHGGAEDDSSAAPDFDDESEFDEFDADAGDDEFEFDDPDAPLRRPKLAKLESRVRTVITFDKGGVWSYLEPPRVDSKGRGVSCESEYFRSVAEAEAGEGEFAAEKHSVQRLSATADQLCKLHLHGVSNFHRFAPFYSVPNCVGLIMGTGNVGPHLRFEKDAVNTYLSRDGGLTWVEAHKGAYIYEFGDHGGLIVMASDFEKTNQVVFSWNEGQSWYDFDLGDDLIDVDNIVIDPEGGSLEFLLYGTRGSVGVIYHLDFASLGQPLCRGAQAAGSVSSDYELWQPTDGRTGDRCILGQTVEFVRRKQANECFHGRHFQRPVTKKACACSERDYQCDFGFTRALDSTDCHPERDDIDFPGCTSGGLFYVDAYRKVPGNRCEGGWRPQKVPVLCPAHSPFSRRARLVLGSVLALGGLLALLTRLQNDRRFAWLLGPDRLSGAKYVVLGGAARFVDVIQYAAASAAAGGTPSAAAAGGAGAGFTEFPDLHDGLGKSGPSSGTRTTDGAPAGAGGAGGGPAAGAGGGGYEAFPPGRGFRDDDDDMDNAPPLLDLSVAHAAGANNFNFSRQETATTPVEEYIDVPRLAPPPPATERPVRRAPPPPGEFEML